MKMKLFIALLASLALLTPPSMYGADTGTGSTIVAPQEITGVAAYVPFPVRISVDGMAEEWKSVPMQTVNRGSLMPAGSAGEFSFSLAADDKNLYVLMLAKDSKIVSGKHGNDWWNEDSLEFYVNFGKKLEITAYTPSIAQFNLKPIDIGKKDPSALTLTGNNTGLYSLKGLVFATGEGWGFEGALALPEGITAAHGLEIGFQAQMNGTNGTDRDTKLIWSLADTADNSWQNPKVFGRALFFKTGSTDIPQPTALSAAAPAEKRMIPKETISYNQLGYLPDAPKRASVARDSVSSLYWFLHDATTGKEVLKGKTLPAEKDPLSGDVLHLIEFSSFKTVGTYYLEVERLKTSAFRIDPNLYADLAKESLAYFYRSRSGIEIAGDLAGKEWARPAGHLSDAKITAFEGKDTAGKKHAGWPGLVIDGSGGWYDAGDYGKYVVNGGITVWTLQNAYERNPKAFPDGALPVPEKGNKAPDLLDEARWELEFMLRMQIPSGQRLEGMVFHKLHDRKWAGLPAPLPVMMDNNNNHSGDDWGRFVYEPSTTATLNLAATAAQASRLWKKIDPAFSSRTLTAAETAWKAALKNPGVIAGSVPGEGGGDYGDPGLKDDFFWAACELYATTGDKEYLEYLKKSKYAATMQGADGNASSSMSWGDTAALGTITLAVAPTKLSGSDRKSFRNSIIAAADRYLEAGKAGYGVPMAESGYVWGSNAVVLNNTLMLGLAADFTGKKEYREGMVRAMDYILGMNALRKSFVTGFGSDYPANIHHRLWVNNPDAGFPAPPPGVIAGGPNASVQDSAMEKAALASVSIPKRYVDSVDSYATNEVAINWNAPLAWVALYLDSEFGKK